MHAFAYFLHGDRLLLPKSFREQIDALMNPVLYTTASVVAFALLLIFRKFFTKPQVAWAVLNIVLFAAGWAMTDPNFQAIVTKPDNVPISLLIFSAGFFTWLALYRGVRNDERMARGEPVLEKLDDDKVLVWPDLVYTELICMVVFTFVLIVWAILLKAPLEPPATTAKAPNPSKAPWYFLGLQEMLVYFDPWMAGVVLPTMIIIGLVALPYIDFNREGNGFYTFKKRWFAITTFMFGFLVLWVTLIVLGTFLRGPNWNFFGPFAYWDPHKVLPLEQRERVGAVLAAFAAPAAGGHEPGGARAARPGAAVRVPVPDPADPGANRPALLLHQDGLRPLHGAGRAAPVHGGPAHQDGPALDAQPEVRRLLPGDLLQHLNPV